MTIHNIHEFTHKANVHFCVEQFSLTAETNYRHCQGIHLLVHAFKDCISDYG